MFSVMCPRHRTRVLLGPRSISALVNTPDGVVVHWHCRCGARGALLPSQEARSQRADTCDAA